MKMPFQIIGFDLDGTMVDSSPELAHSLNYTLSKAGCPPLALEDVISMIGLGVRHLVKSALDRSGKDGSALVDKYLPVMMDHYQAHIGEECSLHPGLAKIIDACIEQGIKIGVVTNKDEVLARKLLEKIGVAPKLSCIIGGDTVGVGKPSPEPLYEMLRRCGGQPGEPGAVYIGDSIHDVEAARAAGLPVVAVSFGFADRPASELGANAVIHRYDQLPAALQQISVSG